MLPLNHIDIHKETVRSQDSVVGIASGYGLGDRGVEVRFPVTLTHGAEPFLRSC
jgi:hypothetical protein